MNIDVTDRKLINLLRINARASISTLAGEMGLARATVQTRLNRLLEQGAIRRFTVEIEESHAEETIRAVMLIQLEGALVRAITKSLRKIPQISTLHTTNGTWDLVAQIETRSLAEFDAVLRDVREVKGVTNSETCLLLTKAL